MGFEIHFCPTLNHVILSARCQLTAFLFEEHVRKEKSFIFFGPTPDRPIMLKFLVITTDLGFRNQNYPVQPA